MVAGYSLGVTPNHPVAGWQVDLSVGDGERAVGVECAVHPLGAGVHIERHLALRRTGWKLTGCIKTAGSPSRKAQHRRRLARSSISRADYLHERA
jgi:hypothetical protein